MLRKARKLAWLPRGVADAIDGANVAAGAMAALTNLVPAPHTHGIYVPRAAAAQLTAFAGFTSPAQVNALLMVGAIAYGMIAETSGAYNGKDVPFAFDTATNAFLPITIPGGAASLPATPSIAGDWTPPTMAIVGSRLMIAHPGYPGGATKFGWLDMSGFSSDTITGNSNGNESITNLGANVLQAGWEIGMTISDSAGDLPANTTIVSIAANGLSCTLSAAATGSHAGTTFTVSGGTATAPLYGAGDCNGNSLLSVPVAIQQFNDRAYFAVGSGEVLSDAGSPCQVTNASQALSNANGEPVTALAGLPVAQATGGILQALLVFQGDAGMVQITGDPATNNLSQNNLGVGAGTLAPNTIAQTPLGVMFIAADGLRFVNFLAQLSEVIGAGGEGVNLPFVNAVHPSRMCAAYNEGCYRVSVQNGAVAGNPVQEYWYHFRSKSWTGPHSFPAALIAANQGLTHGFVMAVNGIAAKLWSHSTIPTANDGYIENGAQLTWQYKTALLPDNDAMANCRVVEGTLAAAFAGTVAGSLTASDDQNAIMDQVSLPNGAAQTLWDHFTWAQAAWAAGAAPYYQHPLPFHNPLDFKQAQFSAGGYSTNGTMLGALRLRYQVTGFLSEQAA